MKYDSDARIDTYHTWQQAQKIPINRGFFIEDLRKLEVAPWDLQRRPRSIYQSRGRRRNQRRLCLRNPAGNKVKTAKASL